MERDIIEDMFEKVRLGETVVQVIALVQHLLRSLHKCNGDYRVYEWVKRKYLIY